MALSDQDLKNIKQMVEATFEEKLDDVLDRKLEEKLSHLPNKEEFYLKMDEIMAELKAIRDHHTVLVHQVSGHDGRLTTLEKAVELHPSP